MAQQNNLMNLEIPDDDIGVVRDLRKKKPLNFKSVGIAFFVVVIVIASFWTSFFIGKALLTPIKKLPDLDFQKLDERFSEERIPLETAAGQGVVTKESLAVYDSSFVAAEEQAAPDPEKKEVKRQNPFTPQKKTEEKPAAKAPAPTKKAAVFSGIFRVRSSVYDSREKAVELVSKLGDAGFEGFVREEISGKFSVQVGVFKNRSNAERLVQQLGAKGFEGEITE